MTQKAIQDFYPEEFAHCFGCGPANTHGLHLKTYETEDGYIASFTPKPYHTGGFPGFVYGGLIAAIIDCHGNGIAASCGYKREQREPNTLPSLRYVTASLSIKYLRPTPMGKELLLKGTAIEVTERKVKMIIELWVDEVVTVKAEMTSALLPSINI